MGIEFENPLTAGTVLVREQIQSQNYDAGVSGWVIKSNGDAEFNDLTIRGTFYGAEFIINDDGMFFYDGTPAAGNLIMSIAAAQGADSFGNGFRRGVMVYSSAGSALQMDAGAGAVGLTFTPPDVTGVTWENGVANVGLGVRLGPNTPVIGLASPYNQASASRATLSLYGQPETSTDPDGVTNEAILSTQRFTVTGNVDIGGEVESPTFQSRVESVSSVGAVLSLTHAVTFTTAYPAGVVPAVVTTINSGAGALARWDSRAISVTASGFTLSLTRGDAGDPAATWTNVPVSWIAQGHS